jgi:hypothetical protein
VTGAPFVRIAAAGASIEVGFHDGHRGYDYELRTDNIGGGGEGLLRAARRSWEAVEAIQARLERLDALERYLDSPRLSIADRWQITPTLRAALSIGRSVVFAAPMRTADVHLAELAAVIPGARRRRYDVTAPEGRVLHVSTRESAHRGLADVDVLVVSSELRDPKVLHSLALTLRPDAHR